MTRPEMRSLLREWGQSEKRIAKLEKKVSEIYAELDTIEGIQAVNMDGMPRGGVGNPTESRAIRAMDFIEQKWEDAANYLHEIEQLDRLREVIGNVLPKLTPRQRQIIDELYRIGGTHEKVSERLRCEPRVLRRIEAAAIDKLREELP